MKNEEIEIKELLLIVYEFFVKRKIFWIVVLILSLLFAGLKYKKVKPYYSSEMIITSNLTYEKSKDLYVPDLQAIISVLETFQTQVEKHNLNFLKQIGLNNPSVLKEMKVNVIIDKSLSRIEPQNIKIDVDVYDVGELEAIQTVILNYCNKNKYIEDRFNLQKTVMQKTVEIVNKRVKFIDTLEYSVKKNVNSNKGSVFLSFNDWNSIVSLESQKYKYNYMLTVEDAISVVQPFSKYPNVNNKKMVSSFAYFFIFIFLGLIVALMLELIKYIRNVKK